MALVVPLSLVLILGADAGAGTAETHSPPQPLTCLARHYKLTPAFEHGAWLAVLPDGARVPFDDGKNKTFEQRLDAPDLKDIFLIPYRPGPIRAVETENEDPGRVRVEAVLTATYGGPATAAAQQVRIRFLGMPVRVHRQIAPALAHVAERLAREEKADAGLGRFLRRLSGGFAARKIAGTERTSAHAFGIAIDLDKSESDYWRWQKAALAQPLSPGHRRCLRGRGLHLGRPLVPLRHHALRVPARALRPALPRTRQRSFGHATALKRRSEPAGKSHSGVASALSPSITYQGWSGDFGLRRTWMSCAGM